MSTRPNVFTVALLAMVTASCGGKSSSTQQDGSPGQHDAPVSQQDGAIGQQDGPPGQQDGPTGDAPADAPGQTDVLQSDVYQIDGPTCSTSGLCIGNPATGCPLGYDPTSDYDTACSGGSAWCCETGMAGYCGPSADTHGDCFVSSCPGGWQQEPFGNNCPNGRTCCSHPGQQDAGQHDAQHDVGPQMDGGTACTGGGGTCTVAQICGAMCPAGTEPTTDVHSDCPGGTMALCCVTAPSSTCSDHGWGLCILGSSCPSPYIPNSSYTCEGGRTCCGTVC